MRAFFTCLVGVLFFGGFLNAFAGDIPVVRVLNADVPGNWQGDKASLISAAKEQLASCLRLSQSETWRIGKRTITRKTWCIESTEKLIDILENVPTVEAAYETILNSFDWFKSIGNDGRGTVQFTGYYSPVLKAKREKTSTYRIPLYSQPSDLVSVSIKGQRVFRRKTRHGYSLYPTRQEIDEQGYLEGRGFEIGFVEDEFDAFIFQVQGAGTLAFTDDTGNEERIFLNYKAANGRPYVSIGRKLREQGVERQYLTIPGMRKYFALNPEKLLPTLYLNPSYVFFEESAKGPLGVDGMVLTAERSIAVDRRYYPMGLLTLVEAKRPVLDDQGEVVDWEPFAKLVFPQDVGGAIKGQGRVDFFWGETKYSELAAGTMSLDGHLYIALPKVSNL